MKLVNWSLLGPSPVIGVDEVGRGCLAGPVVAAAVVLSSYLRRRRFFDSKIVSASRRDEMLEAIQSQHKWSVAFASVEEIDRVNIYHASLLAMRRAVEGLVVGLGGVFADAVGHVVVDGKARIRDLPGGLVQTTFVGGDGRCEPISAASIVAKVTRDRFMKELAARYPGYGFEVHKGYATEFHRGAIAKLGPCPEHRRSFSWGGEREEGGNASSERELD